MCETGDVHFHIVSESFRTGVNEQCRAIGVIAAQCHKSLLNLEISERQANGSRVNLRVSKRERFPQRALNAQVRCDLAPEKRATDSHTLFTGDVQREPPAVERFVLDAEIWWTFAWTGNFARNKISDVAEIKTVAHTHGPSD